jgi:hypothetical protein
MTRGAVSRRQRKTAAGNVRYQGRHKAMSNEGTRAEKPLSGPTSVSVSVSAPVSVVGLGVGACLGIGDRFGVSAHHRNRHRSQTRKPAQKRAQTTETETDTETGTGFARVSVPSLQNNSGPTFRLSPIHGKTIPTTYFAICTSRSTNLTEYPHSLSYQDTSLTKVGLSWMPALASKMDVRGSPRKSVETTSSSV